MNNKREIIAIVAGSYSDKKIIRDVIKTLTYFNVQYDVFIASAHRTPEMIIEITKNDKYSCYIAIAGLAAALPGLISAYTVKPVIGVPVTGKLNFDSLLSMLQMPTGVPVATVGFDNGKNAALLAISILSLTNKELNDMLKKYRKELKEQVTKDNEKIRGEIRNESKR